VNVASPLELRGASGLRLAADRYGPETGPAVLMLHGAGQTRHAWVGTASALADDGWRVVTVDQRGHGDSQWPPDAAYETEDFGADVRALCAQLRCRPVVVGASLGGMAALVAQDGVDGQLYSGVVLVDITPRMDLAGVQRIVGFMLAHPDGFATLEAAADAIASYRGTHLGRRPRTDGLSKVLRPHPDGRWRWHWDARFLLSRHPEGGFDPDEAAEQMDELHRLLLGAAGQVRVPTLLVRGAQSDLVTEEAARELLEVVPDARYVDVSGAGHMVAGDRNDAFTDEVRRFTAWLRTAGAVPDGAYQARSG
jgi:pimeloyl-ACP methyl ester carboxylesterase